MIIIPEPFYKIPARAIVLGWGSYYRDSRSTTFQIWRQIDSEKFKLIGQTRVYSRNKMTLQPQNRFVVNSGDVIGVYFPISTNVSFYRRSSSSCTVQHHARLLLNAGTSALGRIVTTANVNDCLRYPLRVILTGKVFSCRIRSNPSSSLGLSKTG